MLFDSALLPLEAVMVEAEAADWREAVAHAGAGLVRSGATTAAYTDEMVATVEELGPYIVIAPGFALAHSRPSPAVLRPGLSWVQLARPVAFGHASNDPVDLVAGLAALDHDSHLGVMTALARVLASGDTLDTLRRTSDRTAVHRILTGSEPATTKEN
ncbi:MAG TPA: PTS sugar transporter subunit IIA [Jiangellaceae bacterium]|nr:PTS sugar transporter subunit IIA [Jiangellaceae bacterium]